MSKIDIYNQTGEKVGDAELNSKVFGLEKLDAALVHLAVRAQRSNARKSGAHTKNRGEVAGSGKKPWKQKGTGRARAGSVRSPLWRHGGVTFGPTNQKNYSIKLNRSAFKKAITTILTDKAVEKKITVLDKLETNGKSKDMAKFLNNLRDKFSLGKRLLLITEKPDVALGRAVRNLEYVKSTNARNLNVIDLAVSDLVLTKDALAEVEKSILK